MERRNFASIYRIAADGITAYSVALGPSTSTVITLTANVLRTTLYSTVDVYLWGSPPSGVDLTAGFLLPAVRGLSVDGESSFFIGNGTGATGIVSVIRSLSGGFS